MAVGVLVGEGQASWIVRISAVLRVNLIRYKPKLARYWWSRPSILARRRQRADLSSRPVWSTKNVQGQPGIQRETVSKQQATVYL